MVYDSGQIKAKTRIFKNKWFNRYAKKERITDSDICQAICRADKGLIDADLGGGVIKQRIPRANDGRSGGYRSIILFRSGDKAFFVFGFAKKGQANISVKEEKGFRELASLMLEYNDTVLNKLLAEKSLIEVSCDE